MAEFVLLSIKPEVVVSGDAEVRIVQSTSISTSPEVVTSVVVVEEQIIEPAPVSIEPEVVASVVAVEEQIV